MANKIEKSTSLTLGTRSALKLIAAQIRLARKQREWTEVMLAERCGCSRSTIRAIEAGSPTVAIAHVFEAAAMVGIPLLGPADDTAAIRADTNAKLRLMPQRIRPPQPELVNDF